MNDPESKTLVGITGGTNDRPRCPVTRSPLVTALGERDSYCVWRCPASGTDFVWPSPSDDQLKRHYDRTEWFEGGEPGGYANYDSQTEFSLPMVSKLLDELGDVDDGGAARYVLDFGCGYGTHLKLAADRGWKCFGVELSDHARKVAIERHGDAMHIVEQVEELIPHAFDLVLMLDVIEHVADPYALLFSFFNHGLIGPKTRLVISTPNARSVDAVRDGAQWIYRHPPSHLVYYSARSLALLMKTLMFNDVRVRGTSQMTSVDGIGYTDEDLSPSELFSDYAGLICEAEGSRFYAFMLERYVPGTWSKLAQYEHVPRYQFARQFARDARVLDFGCGTGYGSRYLADAADDVLGLDIDADALAWATFWHDTEHLRFERHADLGATLPSAAFDLVTCFEMIEHVDHVTQMATVASLARVVTPTGKLLISTPNPAITANYGENPYHLREMTEAQFVELLSLHFRHIVVLRQWVRPSILIGTEPIPSQPSLTAARLTSGRIVDEPPAFIAVCSHAPIDTIGPFCSFDGSFDMVLAETLLQKTLTGLRFENYLLGEARDEAQRQATQATDEARQHQESDRLHVEALGEQARTIVAMHTSFDEQAACIEASGTHAAALQSALDQQGATIAEQRAGFETQQANIETLRAQLQQKEDSLVAQAASIAAFTSVIERQVAALDQQDRLLLEMRQKFALQEQNIDRMVGDFAAQEQNIRELREQIATREAVIANHDRDYQNRSQALITMEETLRERDQALASQCARTQAVEATVLQRTAEKEEWMRQYAALENTRFVRLARLLHGNSRSRAPLIEATYLVIGGLIPGALKARLAPVATTLRGRFTKKPVDIGAFAPYVVKPPLQVRASRPRVLHVMANFMTGGSSRLVIDLIERLGGEYEQRILTSFIPSPTHYLGADVTEIRGVDDSAAMRACIGAFDPHIIHVHYWGDCDEPWYRAVYAVAEERSSAILQNINTPVAPFADAAIARNVFVSRYVLDHFGDGRAHNMVIYPGSDFTLFAAARKPRRAHECIGMVYRLERDKLDEFAIEPFIEAARAMRRLKCLIVGGGSLLQPFKDRVHAEGLDDSFEFTGYVSYENLPALYRRMDVFVAPIWKESFGQVSAFAMNMGIPVIGYDVGAIPEIVADPSLVAPARDAKALAAIAIRLVGDDGARASIGVANRERATRMFSVEAMIGSYRELYRELMRQ